MTTKREQELVKRISAHYGKAIDLEKSPGVLIEILREYGPDIRKVLDGEGGAGGAPPSPPPTPPSSIAIAGPGSGSVALEDLMRVVLDMRQEIVKLSQRVGTK